ncbi:MAG: cyclodeaminase/cyclohydrolase family protein [Nocardioidaceae bacterium]
MTSRRVHVSWIDQFVVRGDTFSPFRQVVDAAEQLARVAEDRSGLTRSSYEAVGAVRDQALTLAEQARRMEAITGEQARRADAAIAEEGDATQRARVLTAAFSRTIATTARLLDVCHELLVLAEQLLVIRRTKSRLELIAAVEAVRGAASIGHLTVLANLPRITDAGLYDRLSTRRESLDTTLALANRLSAAMRSDTLQGPVLPSQRMTTKAAGP